jgi:hypothetical protein
VIGEALADLRYGLSHPWARAGLRASLGMGVLLVAATLAWWPRHAASAQLHAQLADLREHIVRARRDSEVLAAYQAAKVDVAALEKKLDYAATQAQQVGDFEELAHRLGVTIVSQSFETAGRDDAQSVLNTDLIVQGSYRSLRNFIAAMPELASLTEVDEVVLERAREPGMVKGRIRLVTYRHAVTGSSAS